MLMDLFLCCQLCKIIKSLLGRNPLEDVLSVFALLSGSRGDNQPEQITFEKLEAACRQYEVFV